MVIPLDGGLDLFKAMIPNPVRKSSPLFSEPPSFERHRERELRSPRKGLYVFEKKGILGSEEPSDPVYVSRFPYRQ
jgi:hypothetical protein